MYTAEAILSTSVAIQSLFVGARLAVGEADVSVSLCFTLSRPVNKLIMIYD